MAGHVTVLKGIIHGKTIQLDNEPGLPDGQPVRVVLQPLEPPATLLVSGEGIRLSAGAWADDAEELDRYIEWNRRQRHLGRREVPE